MKGSVFTRCLKRAVAALGPRPMTTGVAATPIYERRLRGWRWQLPVLVGTHCLLRPEQIVNYVLLTKPPV